MDETIIENLSKEEQKNYLKHRNISRIFLPIGLLGVPMLLLATSIGVAPLMALGGLCFTLGILVGAHSLNETKILTTMVHKRLERQKLSSSIGIIEVEDNTEKNLKLEQKSIDKMTKEELINVKSDIESLNGKVVTDSLQNKMYFKK